MKDKINRAEYHLDLPGKSSVKIDANMIMIAAAGFRKNPPTTRSSIRHAVHPVGSLPVVVSSIILAVALMACLPGCDNSPSSDSPPKSQPKSPDSTVPNSVDDGPFHPQAQSIYQHLNRKLPGKTLIGYGGRRFRVEFESQIQVDYPQDSPESKKTRAVLRLLHWQVQKQESMKYEMLLSFELQGQDWHLKSGTNRYLGMKDKTGFKPAEGFKKLNVLKRIKGNVYDRPIHEAVADVLGK